MKWIFIAICLLYIPLSVFAQYENVWITYGMSIDFNATPPQFVAGSFNIAGECTGSVCDAQGNLLFYSDGSQVLDRNNYLMPNGVNLTGLGSLSTQSTTQGVLIVPMPGNVNRYYIFSLTQTELGAQSGKLYYSAVDMSLNNGLGDIVPGEKGILIDSNLTEKLTGIVGDRCNIWILVHSYTANTFRSFELTASGINTTAVTSGVGIIPYYAHLLGDLTPSSDGKKIIACAGFGSGLEIFDFDRTTGYLSNPQLLDSLSSAYYSACFSPDNSKVYALTHSLATEHVYQFDLNSSTPAATKTLIDSCSSFTKIKLAPDGKIYYRSYGGNTAIITDPNAVGLACNLSHDTQIAIQSNLPNVVPFVIHATANPNASALEAPCLADNYTLSTNSPGWDHLWDDGSTGTTRSVYAPGTYWVSYTGPPCTYHVDTFHVTFPNGVLPAVQIDTACAGTANGRAYATTYPGDTVYYAYTWLSGTDTLSFSDTLASVPSGNYTLLVHTVNCDTSLNFVIPEVDYRVRFTISDTLLCMGDVLQFQNTSDGHFSQFAWYSGDGDSSLLAEPAGHTYAHAGSYDILLTGSGPICNDTARRHLTVDSLFSAAFTMDQGSVCVGDAVRFRLADANITFTGLQWDWGDDSYLQAAYENSFSHAFDHPGTFTIQVTLNARACPDTFFTDTVQVYALPEVYLGGDTSLCLDGHAVVLRNLAPAPDEPYHYLWSTGDTTAGLRVLQPGSYRLRITTAPLGCTATDAIEVTKDCYTDIPNAFTPNGDSDNDYFFPRTQLSKSIGDFKMQVFNRWGQLLFETANIAGRGWDGRFNDQEQPMGVYIYLVDVVYNNGRKEEYKGNVTLIR